MSNPDRQVPGLMEGEIAHVVFMGVMSPSLTAGPSPASISRHGSMNFFFVGPRVREGRILIYGPTGSLVRELSISDNALTQQSRIITTWDLRNSSGNIVTTSNSYEARANLSLVGGTPPYTRNWGIGVAA